MLQFRLLKSRRFLPLFITQFFGAFNDNAFKNAFLIWYTYEVAISDSSHAGLMVTIASGIFILPYFLFSAIAGQMADKLERATLAQWIKLIEILLMCGCALFFMLGQVSGLLVILFLMGTHSTFFSPVKYSLLPEHLEEKELMAGNGLIEAGTFLAILLGTIFGGLMVMSEHGLWLLSACLVTFALIGWTSSRFIPPASIKDASLKMNWNLLAQSIKIIHYVKAQKQVWFAIIAISWFWFIGMMFLTQFPTYTKNIIHGTEAVVTLFLTLFSVGIAIGSAMCNRLQRGNIHARYVPYGCLGMLCSIGLFVIASIFYSVDYLHYVERVLSYEEKMLTIAEFLAVGFSSYAILLSLFALSVCAGIYVVPLYTVMQHRSNPAFISRTIAVNNIINALGMVLASGLAVAVYLAGLDVIGLFGIVCILCLIVWFILYRAITVKKVLENNA